MTGETPTPQEIREMDKKEVRKQFPSGWMEVARYETLVLTLDALLEAPAVREFTLEELADQAGTTPKSLDNRIDSLVELSVIEAADRDGERQYTLNADSPVVDQLYELNAAVQRVRDGSRESPVDHETTDEGVSAVADDVEQKQKADTGGSRYSLPGES